MALTITPEKSCAGKRTMTKREAESAANMLRRRGFNVGPYDCPFCDWWHVGRNQHEKKRHNQRRRRR